MIDLQTMDLKDLKQLFKDVESAIPDFTARENVLVSTEVGDNPLDCVDPECP